MISTYDILNESMAYYLSTIYFKNPLYEGGNISGCHDDDDSDAIGDQQRNSMGYESSFQQNEEKQTENQSKLQDDSVLNDIQYFKEQKQQTGSSNKKVQLYLEQQRRRLSQFCDNVKLTFVGKWFVMELNFKRRLGIMRNYLNRTMPWILPSSAQGKKRQNQATKNNSNTLFPEDTVGGKSFWNDIKPPRSRECLGEQQEKILYRLALAKRVSRKLFTIDDADEEEENQDDEIVARNSRTPLMAFSQSVQSELDGFGTEQQAPEIGRMYCSSKASLEEEDEAEAATRLKATKTATTTTTPSARIVGPKSKRSFIPSRKLNIRNAACALTTPKVNKKLCVVCYQNTPNIITLPCKHHDICSDCFIEIIYVAVKRCRYPLKCVLCRQKIEKIRCSRQLLLSVIERNRSSTCIGK